MNTQPQDLRAELASVLALLDKATPGEWRCTDGPAGYQHRISSDDADGETVCDVERTSADASAIAAAVNFLRKHGAALTSHGGGEVFAWFRDRPRAWEVVMDADLSARPDPSEMRQQGYVPVYREPAQHGRGGEAAINYDRVQQFVTEHGLVYNETCRFVRECITTPQPRGEGMVRQVARKILAGIANPVSFDESPPQTLEELRAELEPLTSHSGGVEAVPEGLISALRHQRQVDEEGIECGVSRQAVDEAISILESLAQPRGEGMVEVRRIYEKMLRGTERLRQGSQDSEYGTADFFQDLKKLLAAAPGEGSGGG